MKQDQIMAPSYFEKEMDYSEDHVFQQRRDKSIQELEKSIFFDKSALNYSSMLGIKEEASLNDTQFGWLGSIFFIGFLLGVFEAGVFPSATILISRLYRRNEQFTRIAVFYIVSGLSMSTGGILSYGIGHMDGICGLRAWKWMMLILGNVTVLVGILCFFILKDDAKSIVSSPSEEAIIDLRIKDNSVIVTRKFKMSQITEALTEYRYYCYMGFSFLVSLQNGALLVFSSIITKGFGFSNLNAILLGIPSGITDILFIIAALVWQHQLVTSAYHYLACVFLLGSSIGHLLLIVIPLSQAKLAGLYFCFAYVAAVALISTSISSNVSGYTKKIFYNSSIVVFSTLGSFAGPQMMLESQKPTYIGGLVGYIVANLVSGCLLLIARQSMAKRNSVRFPQQQDDEFLGHQIDITDVEDPHFIYKL
ncbi:hypothetical protein MUCCIDRAFT_167940 [Mucor lusitanicus CBS 277.49]|uniref:Major facilitator superfamily (MFS) profile domain-containing protein n=1 Tax=Mucor lusitanicus CBS 277.49 TaxID=747725 RepID=A0A168H2Z5_MUCCL|nr:hypothetical protein MUCCIDRAFT_167940 [Mucor lusitanicus CBS 277.49]